MHCLVSTQGCLCVDFRRSVVDPLRVAGFSDAPGSVGEILGLQSEVTSTASIQLCRSSGRKAGAVSIFSLQSCTALFLFGVR
ncbi:hypothetical protein NDU88_007215 [Pleurodeles waltl]|uniref:Uncharacterized protein n=1 Tax=Pleurodeles waltl TaxID=8319 RepID=A0AAV7TZ75_PLEWA|nr:hypothetical protein NDU88_007215 [Pleurodeles waltl]